MTVNRGTATDLGFTDDNGFGVPDPTDPAAAGDIAGCGVSVNFTHCGPADQGAQFNFDFGSLAAGDSVTFDIFYGADTDEATADADLGALGAEAFALGESSIENPATGGEVANTASATFYFGFTGIGGAPIIPPPPVGTPEPSSLAMLASGLMGLYFVPRRKRS